jgi:hypothetical protein
LISGKALEQLRLYRPQRRGCKPALPLASLLQGLLFHVLFPSGTFAEHLRQLSGWKKAESTLAERRTALGWPAFAQLLRQALRPLALLKRNPEAFWHGLRLVAWDGTQFSLTNTPQVQAKFPKAATRRKKAAWAKMTAVVLLEIGLHNPLAAAVGEHGQSEYALTRDLIGALPQSCLLLADRLCGVPVLIAEIYAACRGRSSHFLIRTRHNLLVQKRRRLRDGSALVEVGVRDPKHRKKVTEVLQLREIQVRISRPGHRGEVLRLWTSLLDPQAAPALELVRLYAQRWEQELYWRQMKLELRRTSLLQSHTSLTAAQEIVMLILATALLAHERARAANGKHPVLQISFVKCLALLRPLWLTLCLAGHVLSPAVQRALCRIFEREIQRCLKSKRRARSCLRAVRQPIKGWPRMLRPAYTNGHWRYQIIRTSRP